jgi:replicative DNA helicase
MIEDPEAARALFAEDAPSALPEPKPKPQTHQMLPHSMDAEKAVLCSIFIDPAGSMIMCAALAVDSSWFYLPAHGIIFDAMEAAWAKSQMFDLITITQALHDEGTLDRVGGPAFLAEIQDYIATAALIEEYLETLAALRMQRNIVLLGQKATKIGMSRMQPEEVAEAVDTVEKEALSIRRMVSPIVTVCEAATRAEAAFAEKMLNPQKKFGLSTGFPGLDLFTGGLHPGEVTLIAARPGNGKTAIAANMAEDIALNQGLPVAFFSLEMTLQALIDRMILSRGGINMEELRHRSIKPNDMAAYSQSAREFAESNLIIEHERGLDITVLKQRARAIKHKFPALAAIFVDYVQLLKARSLRASQNRVIELGDITAGLVDLCGELNIPIVALAQLSRDPDKRGGDGRPKVSDLRESGSLEQDASNVHLIHRPELYAATEEERINLAGQASLIIGKQRNGPTGDIPLIFRKQFTRFESPLQPEEQTHMNI